MKSAETCIDTCCYSFYNKTVLGSIKYTLKFIRGVTGRITIVIKLP